MAGLIDLHMHTTTSDGSDTPALLLEKLRAAGVTAFAVTDHDTVLGAREMLSLPHADLEFFPGVEFSCVSPEGECHILGYCADFDDAAFVNALETGRELRRKKLERRLERLKTGFGIVFPPEDVEWLRAQDSPGKPHFGQLLVRRGHAETIQEAIREYFGGLKEAASRIPAEMAVDGILRAGGVPVWAHPLGGEGEKRIGAAEFGRQLDVLLGYGVRGLECCYSRYTAEESAFLRGRAQARGLLVSGGSDYHGANKRDIRLGQLNAESAPVPPEALTLLPVLRERQGE